MKANPKMLPVSKEALLLLSILVTFLVCLANEGLLRYWLMPLLSLCHGKAYMGK